MIALGESQQLAPTKCSIRVVVVDDHFLLREGVAALLAKCPGIELVGEACNGQEGVAAFRKLCPDVLLMDLQMPVMNGIDALHAIKDIQPNARVIMLSTFSGDTRILRALQAGADGYMLKGSIGFDLSDAITKVHAGMKYVQPDVALALAAGYSYETLSNREVQVVRLVAQGNSNKEVARSLSVTEDTVKGYMTNILAKLQAKDRTHAVVIAMRRGILAPE
jgi:DNA-binding NarL/FixJ family response regulator